jgi:hypothetical protein
MDFRQQNRVSHENAAPSIQSNELYVQASDNAMKTSRGRRWKQKQNSNAHLDDLLLRFDLHGHIVLLLARRARQLARDDQVRLRRESTRAD